MADLNVSDVLDDPDFWTDLVLIPSIVQIGEGGIAEDYAASKAFVGVVIPDGGRDLIQSGEGDMVSGDITVYTRESLSGGDAERGADKVIWNRDTYTVIQAQPWLYGDGYYRAVCKLGSLNPSGNPTNRNAGFLSQR